MLQEFLIAERHNILSLCAEKYFNLIGPRPHSPEMDNGLPVFYDELIAVLSVNSNKGKDEVDRLSEDLHRNSAIRCGQESLRLGYTISQVVHGYGALCQAITEYATKHCPEPISSKEFNRLNFCLDEAIAQAVTEFNKGQKNTASDDEIQRLGFLAHELRNALTNASTAHHLMKMGVVGLNGGTSRILETALRRMKDIIDRSLSEVRLHREPSVNRQLWRMVDLVGEVEAAALSEAHMQEIQLHVEVDPSLSLLVDRHLAISAISNLLQNAIKFTHKGGNIWIRGRLSGDRILLQIEDQCGGLPPGKIDSLFQAFTQEDEDKSGLGLGLTISRQAIALNDGQLSATDLPGKGCVFTIDLPLAPMQLK